MEHQGRSFVFNATGGFLIQNGECCHAVHVRTVKPSWTQVLRYENDQQAYNQPTQVFTGGVPLHSYFYNNSTASPTQLLVHDINELWHFTESFDIGSQPASLFHIPSDCSSTCIKCLPSISLQDRRFIKACQSKPSNKK